ncbi:MAG: polysaccharide deacetylase family protein [Candidatus Omnitrophica bacterium]|nr:polysaccharide deacetylase family protein [Candidatus Omnitrophota bacterium]
MRVMIKNLAKYMYHYSGMGKCMFRTLRNSKGPVLLTIVYHRICRSMDSYEYMAMPADVFESHVKVLNDNFKIVTIAEGLDLVCKEKRKGIYVSINFDDGYMDNYTHAFPILKKYGAPANIFLTTDFIGQEHLFWWDEVFQTIHRSGNSLRDAYRAIRINDSLMDRKGSEIEDFVDNLRKQAPAGKKINPSLMLGWNEIKEMTASGISFGSHTKSHGNMRLMEDAKMRSELMESKLCLEEKLGTKEIGFCYPFGIYDDRVRGIVKDAGFNYARTCVKGSNYKNIDRFSLKSIDVSFLLDKALFTSLLSFYSLMR